MIDLHSVGHGGVDTSLHDGLGAGFGQGFGYVEGAGCGVEIADGIGGHANAKRRHDVVEKAVVVIGPQEHDQLRIEAGDAFAGIADHAVHFGQHFGGRVDVAHQRRV